MNIVKWFRNRRRVNRRRVNRRWALVKIGWVALLLICAGCEQPRYQKPSFQRGQFVDIRIGRRGQIIKVYDDRNGPYYSVRVNTDQGPKRFLLNEFELVIK